MAGRPVNLKSKIKFNITMYKGYFVTFTGLSRMTAVSKVQHRGTLRSVYPPPPRTSIGTLNDFMKSTQSAWPRNDRLKQPRRSCAGKRSQIYINFSHDNEPRSKHTPERLSAPHCSTTAVGPKRSMTRDITGRNTDLYKRIMT